MIDSGSTAPPGTHSVHTARAKVECILVVEDDRELCDAVARVAAARADEVLVAHDAAHACALLARGPHLVLLDVRLPDGSAFDVLERAGSLRPTPVFVAMSGQATPEEAFRLARAGVRAYVAKPFTPGQLDAQISRALEETPRIEPFVAATVGRRGLRDLQNDVRRTMVEEALAQSQGSRTGAARLLGITRQAVQQILRDRSDEESPETDDGAGAGDEQEKTA